MTLNLIEVEGNKFGWITKLCSVQLINGFIPVYRIALYNNGID